MSIELGLNLGIGKQQAGNFSPAWQQFDGAAWLYKNSDLTGIPTNSAGIIAAVTYSPSAADIASGVARNLLLPISATNRLVTINKGASNGMTATAENTADAILWNCSGGGGLLVVGGFYLILFSVNPSGVGGKARLIDLATGAILAAVDDADTGTLGGPSASGWVIGSASAVGSAITDGKLERVMLWANTYADVNDAAVQALFYANSRLQDPYRAISALGTPHIAIAGADLRTGVNAGSGGNFTKTGVGSITAA